MNKKAPIGIAPVGAFSSNILFCPELALLYSCAVGSVTVDGVTAVLSQQLAGDIGTFTAVKESLFLTANCHRAFTVEWMAVGFNTSSAITGLSVRTAAAK